MPGSDRKTQPILCCIGEAVAGQPTQFVMERAFAAQGMDWRVLTTEVTADDFSAAVAGMQAMKFQAIRFFGDFQARAIVELLNEESSAERRLAEFTQGITSAGNVRGVWSGWNNLGFGICSEISRQVALSELICWLHGDSLRTRSVLAAFCVHPPKAIILTDAPTDAAVAMEQIVASSSCPVRCMQVDDVASYLDEMLPPTNPLAFITSAMSVNSPGLETIQSMLGNQLDAGGRILIVADRSTDLVFAKSSGANIVSETDQIVAAEAYDFTRWTGHALDLPQFRDAFDEYCDF